MKKQILGLILLTAFLMSLMLVSAGDFSMSLVSPSSINYTTGSANLIFNIANNNLTYNAAIISITGSASRGIFGNYTISTNITNQTNQNFTITLTSIPAYQTGAITFNIIVNRTINGTNTIESFTALSLPVINNKMCSVSNPGKLEVSNIEFNVVNGFGDDEDYWYPLDDVEVSFDVDNTGSGDIRNIEVTACLVDNDAGDGKCIIDEGDMDLSDDDFDLDSGDDTTITMTFNLDPDYFDAGNTQYALYIAVSGEINSGTYKRNDSCASSSEDIDINTDEQFVILNNIEVPEIVSCVPSLEITADIWNIGNEDIENDEIFVGVYNKELGIDKIIGISSDLDSMEMQEITMNLNLPKEYAEKTYAIKFTIYDDETANSNDVYTNNEDDEAVFDILVPLKKCSITPETNASISVSAELSSDTPKAVIGDQFIVEATIKNTGTSSAVYNLSVSGNEAWSKVTSIEPNAFTLASGESKTVSITFDVNSNAKAGDKDFTIKTLYDSKTSEQKVLVTLEEGLSSSKIIQHLKANSFIYSIILINLILLIAIIIVVVKMFGRKASD